MSDEKSLYWLSQVVGWFGYIVLILFTNVVDGTVDVGIIKVLLVNFVLGVGLSHLMRSVIIKTDLLNSKIYNLFPGIIALSVLTGAIAAIIYGFISDTFFTEVEKMLVMPIGVLLQLIVPFTTVFLIWNILYFAAIFLKNYEREEVKNLRLTASMNEVELNNLRSQMNPHFIFNALNSIKALVDEDPSLAKRSITQMSHILRSSLASGKKKFVSLGEELKVVNDYLELEKIRYEERLSYQVIVGQEYHSCTLPPLLIQTLVENAIKHGIAHLPKGGRIVVQSKFESDNLLKISVANSGQLKNSYNSDSTAGIGLENSRRRLNLLYGDKASLTIFNDGNQVVCDVIIPYEKTRN